MILEYIHHTSFRTCSQYVDTKSVKIETFSSGLKLYLNNLDIIFIDQVVNPSNVANLIWNTPSKEIFNAANHQTILPYGNSEPEALHAYQCNSVVVSSLGEIDPKIIQTSIINILVNSVREGISEQRRDDLISAGMDRLKFFYPNIFNNTKKRLLGYIEKSNSTAITSCLSLSFKVL